MQLFSHNSNKHFSLSKDTTLSTKELSSYIIGIPLPGNIYILTKDRNLLLFPLYVGTTSAQVQWITHLLNLFFHPNSSSKLNTTAFTLIYSAVTHTTTTSISQYYLLWAPPPPPPPHPSKSSTNIMPQLTSAKMCLLLDHHSFQWLIIPPSLMP